MLPPCDRLASFMSDIHRRCVLCGVEDESMDHRFAGCSFTQELWSEVRSRFPGAGLIQDTVLLLMLVWHRRWQVKGDRHIWWLILHATLWVIWGEKQHDLHEGISNGGWSCFFCFGESEEMGFESL